MWVTSLPSLSLTDGIPWTRARATPSFCNICQECTSLKRHLCLSCFSLLKKKIVPLKLEFPQESHSRRKRLKSEEELVSEEEIRHRSGNSSPCRWDGVKTEMGRRPVRIQTDLSCANACLLFKPNFMTGPRRWTFGSWGSCLWISLFLFPM